MYNTEKVFERCKVRLGLPNSEKDNLLKDIIQSAEDFVTIHTNLLKSEYHQTLESIVLQMTLELYNKYRSEGFNNETIEGVTIRYEDTFTKYEVPLRRYRKLKML